MEPIDYFTTEEAAVAAGHHPACDGWRMHSVQAQSIGQGMFKPYCPLCGTLPVVGSGGSPPTALSMGAGHERSERCRGECREW